MLSHIEPHPKCPLDSRRIIASATRLSSNRTAYFTSARKAATWAADHASRFQDQFLGSWTRQKWVIKLLDRTTILIHAEVCSFLAVFRWFHVGATPANMISPQGCMPQDLRTPRHLPGKKKCQNATNCLQLGQLHKASSSIQQRQAAWDEILMGQRVQNHRWTTHRHGKIQTTVDPMKNVAHHMERS